MIDFKGDWYRFVLICDVTGMRFRVYRDLRANKKTSRLLRGIVREYKRIKATQKTGYRLILLRRRAIPKHERQQSQAS